MKKFILLISILSSLPISYAQNVWESTGGPDVGDITHVLSINDSILLAGSQRSNIYKSTDFGNEWFIVVETAGDGVPGMVVTSDNTIFASIAFGVYKSTDYGITWHNIFSNMGGWLYLSRDEELLFLIPEHVRSYFMYATVRGNSWTYIDLPFTGYLFQFSQNQMQDKWILCSSEGVYVSTDNGINWEDRNSGLLTTNVRSILINDNDETFIGTIDGVYYSTNFGMDWELKNQGIPANTTIYDFLELSDSILVIGSSKGSFITYDKGISWYVLSNKINDLRISSLTHFGFNNILLGSNTGTYIFSDSIMQRKSIGISEITINDVNQVGNRLFAGSRNGLNYSDNGGDKWLFIDDVPQLIIRNIEIDSPYVYFITNNYGWGLWRSSDEGNNWTFIEQQGCCTELISFSNHYLSAGLFYPNPHLPPYPHGVWYSSNFGNFWNEGGLPSVNIVTSLGKDSSERLFIGTEDLGSVNELFHLFISTDYGITCVNSGVVFLMFGLIVLKLIWITSFILGLIWEYTYQQTMVIPGIY